MVFIAAREGGRRGQLCAVDLAVMVRVVLFEGQLSSLLGVDRGGKNSPVVSEAQLAPRCDETMYNFGYLVYSCLPDAKANYGFGNRVSCWPVAVYAALVCRL